MERGAEISLENVIRIKAKFLFGLRSDRVPFGVLRIQLKRQLLCPRRCLGRLRERKRGSARTWE